MDTIKNETIKPDPELDRIWAERKAASNNSYLARCSMCDETLYLPYKNPLKAGEYPEFQIKFFSYDLDYSPHDALGDWNYLTNPKFRRPKCIHFTI